MTLTSGDEFSKAATPDQALLLKLAALADAGSGSVLIPATENGGAPSRRTATANTGADMMRFIAQQQHEDFVRRINEQFDRMDEANVRALQNIEEELAILRRERAKMREQAYHDEEGRAIFMKEDESAAFYEDGTQLDDETFASIKERLIGKPTKEAWDDFTFREDALLATADQIHVRQSEQDRVRADVAAGRISDDEAARRFQALDEQPASGEFAMANIRRDSKTAEPEKPTGPLQTFQF
jgi:hypothetical protein